MTDSAQPDRKALIRRVEELAQRQLQAQEEQAREEVPLLTEVVDAVALPAQRIPAHELEEIATRLEAAVLEQLAPEIDRVIEAAHAGLKAEIAASVKRAVREALAPLAG